MWKYDFHGATVNINDIHSNEKRYQGKIGKFICKNNFLFILVLCTKYLTLAEHN